MPAYERREAYMVYNAKTMNAENENAEVVTSPVYEEIQEQGSVIGADPQGAAGLSFNVSLNRSKRTPWHSTLARQNIYICSVAQLQLVCNPCQVGRGVRC